MQVWKKFSAVALALVMSLALCAPAFAGQTLASSNIPATTDPVEPAHPLGTAGNKDIAHDSLNEAVTINKVIKAYNTGTGDSIAINEPTATYTYTVTAVAVTDPAKTVTDADGVQVNAKEGIVPGLKVTSTTNTAGVTAGNDATNVAVTLAYAPTAQFNASKNGVENTKTVTFDFSNVVFTQGTGVYRYLITETVNAYTTAGIVEGSTGHVRYLDVYVKQAPADTFASDSIANKDKWDVYGFALFAPTNANIASALGEGIYKTTGFVADQSKTADAYYTYNVTITKNLVNDSFNNSHKFPFKVDFTNTSVTANVLPIVSTAATTETVPSLTAGNINDMDVDETSGMAIANGGSVKFTGIPAGTTLKIDEKNDVTGTTYTVTTTSTGSAAFVNYSNLNVVSGWAADVANNDNDVTVTLATKANGDNMSNDSDVAVTFTNTLTNISPTGVTLRYAPYLAMMGAGIVALPLSLRKKEEEI